MQHFASSRHSNTQLWGRECCGLEEKDKKNKDSKKAQKVLGTLGWDMTCTLIHFDFATVAAVFSTGRGPGTGTRRAEKAH